MRTGRWLALVLGFLLLLPAVSCTEEAAAGGAFSLVPEGDPRMRYDGVSFSDAWPEDIAADMEDFFPGERVISGIRYEWQPLAGGPVTIVFAACGSEGPEKLIGAWYYEWMPGRGKTEFWHGKTDLFFDTGMIDAAAFPSTVEEAYACCEPNG